MIMQMKQATLALPCVRARYTGKYTYAALVLDVGTPAAPVLKLGVSNTSLADAVSNVATIITGDGTLTIRDVVASVRNHSATTASHDVLENEFDCEINNAIYTDVFGGSVNQYAAAAGSLNLKDQWQDALLIDDDVAGTTTLRLPPCGVSNGAACIKNIAGHPGESTTPTVTRSIYDIDGNLKWSTGAIATATDLLLNPNTPTFVEPIVFSLKPVVVRDTCANVAHNTATTLAVTWMLGQAKYM